MDMGSWAWHQRSGRWAFASTIISIPRNVAMGMARPGSPKVVSLCYFLSRLGHGHSNLCIFVQRRAVHSYISLSDGWDVPSDGENSSSSALDNRQVLFVRHAHSSARLSRGKGTQLGEGMEPPLIAKMEGVLRGALPDLADRPLEAMTPAAA